MSAPIPALVRFDLADTARVYRLRCLAHCIEIAETPSQWRTIEAEFRSVCSLVKTDRLPSISADAAARMAAGDATGAAERLAAYDGETVERWASIAARMLSGGHGNRVADAWEPTAPALDAERESIAALVVEASQSWGALTRAQQDVVGAFAEYVAEAIRARKAVAS